MKFIAKHKNLIEKFILDERFILNEASDTDELLPEINQTLGNIAIMVKDFDNQINAIKKIATENKLKLANFDIENPNKNACMKLIADINTLIDELSKNKLTIANNETNLFELLTEDALSIRDELQKTSDKIDGDSIKNAEVIKALSNTFTPLIKNLDKFKEVKNDDNLSEIINNSINNLGKCNINKLNSDLFEELNDQMDEFKSKVENNISIQKIIQATDPNIEIKSVKDTLVDTCSKIEATIKEIKDYTEQDELNNVSTDVDNADMDWDKAFEETINQKLSIKDFWADYFKTEFTDMEHFFESIDDVFKIEIKEFGLNVWKNPFLYFLKTLWKQDGLAIEALINNPSAYNAIHDAVIERDLEEKDLTGDGKLGDINIIFNSDFCSKDYIEASEYLVLQKEAIDLYNDGNKFKHNITAEKYGSSLQNFITDLFYQPGNTIVNNGKRQEGNIKNKLNSIIDIENKLKVLFGTKAFMQTQAKHEAESNTAKPVILKYKDNVANFLKTIIEKTGKNSKEDIFTYLLKVLKEKDESMYSSKGNTIINKIKNLAGIDWSNIDKELQDSTVTAKTLAKNKSIIKQICKEYNFSSQDTTFEAIFRVIESLVDKLNAGGKN